MGWHASLLNAARRATTALPITAVSASALSGSEAALGHHRQLFTTALSSLCALRGDQCQQPGFGERCALHSLLQQPQPLATMGSLQQQRQFFNLPGSGSSEIAKEYSERRLIGYALVGPFAVSSLLRAEPMH